ncbi:MAG: NADH-quinone oxidoreductase subunit C [Bdellovibrionota bacterium]
MINKKIHADFISQREQNQPEPEIQTKLRESLLATFGDRLTLAERGAWEFGLTFELKREHAQDVFQKLKDDPQFSFNMLVDITAVDWLDRREPRFDVVYQLLSLSHLHRVCLKIRVSEDKPEVDSVRPLWPAANFLEREIWDMFGITFAGHGDLRRVLLYDEFVGHPLRKDYPIRGKQPRVPLRIPELRNTADDMRREPLVSLPAGRHRKTAAQG